MTTALAGAVVDLPTMDDPRLKEPTDLATRAAALVVTRDNKPEAEELLLALAAAEKKVGEVMDPICEAAHRAHKEATGQRGKLLKPIQDAKLHLRRGCATVQQELEREARAEEERKLAELRSQEEARRESEAVDLMEAGDAEGAMEVLERPVVVPTQSAAVPVQKTAGVSYRDDWRWEPEKKDFAGEPNIDAVPREFLQLNESALSKYARAMGPRAKVAGIRFFSVKVPVTRAR